MTYSKAVSVPWPQKFVIHVLVYIFHYLITVSLFAVAAVKNVSGTHR